MTNGRNGRINEALDQAVKDWESAGKHRSELVRGITTERTLQRYIDKQVRPSPFISRQIARRLKRPYKEVFGG